MYLPPLQPIANSEIQICGDVEIHPTASIAPGVILKAATNSRIVIGADVCLGMGVILCADSGSIEIEVGATLGSGVLIIGDSKIGANACIGIATTIFNDSIAAMTVISPGSLIGDHSRSWQEEEEEEEVNKPSNISEKVIDSETKISANGKPATQENNLTSAQGLENESDATEKEISNLESNTNSKETTTKDNPLIDQEVVPDSDNIADSDPWSQEEIPVMTSPVAVEETEQNLEMSPGVAIGKVYIDQLLVTLFPHKNSPNNNSKNNSR
ncbi:MAG: carbon dioxide concentrating mechanism protein [Xenococcus sp. (in: cyanobacteria)]